MPHSIRHPVTFEARYFLYQYVRLMLPVTFVSGVQFWSAAFPLQVVGPLALVPGGFGTPQPMQNFSSFVTVVLFGPGVVSSTRPATGLGGRPPPESVFFATSEVNGLTA